MRRCGSLPCSMKNGLRSRERRMHPRMDAAVPVDAQNAPTATWKTAQNAVSHSAQTHQPVSHTKFLTLPFDPLDNARFVKMARASMLECHNHLGDAVDRKRITEETRHEHLVRWETAIKEIGG